MLFSREDIEAWKAATRNVRKFLHLSDPEPSEDASEQIPPIDLSEARRAPKKLKQSSPAYFPDIYEGDAGRMDKNSFTRLKSGKIRPHIVEDLHGMGLQDAREHFFELIQSAHASGKRSVLLITGKGFEAPGKIRSSLPSWINDPDLKPLILAYTHAQPKDGGKGAFYIYLSK